MDKVDKILWLIPLLVVSVSSLKTGPGSNFTNIHEGLHCWDVSTYLPPDTREEPREKCITEFPKITIDKEEEVCVNHTSVNCTIVGYTECEMTPVKTPYNLTMMMKRNFTRKYCHMQNVTDTHWKKIPECKPVTKQQCITNWVVDGNGNKIWTDNEDCKNVTWNECELKPKPVNFTTLHSNCTRMENETWWDCVKMPNETITYNMTCTPKAALNCTPVVKELCTKVKWMDSYQIAEESCEDKWVDVPYQTRKHRKQCILSSGSDKLDDEILQDVEPFDSVEDLLLKLEPGKRKRRNARKSFHYIPKDEEKQWKLEMKKSSGN